MRQYILVACLAVGFAASECGCIQVAAFPPAKVQKVIVERSERWIEWNRIALVDIDGFIGSGLRSWLSFGGASVADVKEKLQMAAEDWRVRAVVLRINSPGGEAAASDMIHQEVRRFRNKTGKPVVAVLLGTGASGGYYIACAADRILATPGAITGSVGVLMEFLNVEGLYGKIGLRTEVIKSGDKKDIASSTRALTPEERAILQRINRGLFERFLRVVRDGRPNMTDEQLANVSDGRVLTAEEAFTLNMLDGIGYLEDAIALARELAGIGGADVVLYRASRSPNANIYAIAGADRLIEGGLEILLRHHGPTFLYLWSPGTN